jgi:hypothetical protein
MRAASPLFQKVLGDALSFLHAYRRCGLLLAVESAVHSRALTLIDLARSYPATLRVRTALKRLDRLLGNTGLHANRAWVYRAMARLLLSSAAPLIVVDWSELKKDGRWCLLRAAIPVKGRSLTVLETVVPRSQLGSGKVQRHFLLQLQAILPKQACPILITDAGFRSDWFAAVEALKWSWVGRLRGRIRVRRMGQEAWMYCHDLHALQRGSARDLGQALVTRDRKHACRLVIGARRQLQGRHALTNTGERSADRRDLLAASSTREPNLLACSLNLNAYKAAMIERMYQRRMQIEETFRDLKSHHFGMGFEDTQTRKPERLQMLLLIHALAQWVQWVVGLVAITHELDEFLKPNSSKRQQYSTIRIGREFILKGSIGLTIRQILPPDIPIDSIPPPLNPKN